jgi:hypothetical protein
VPRNPEKELLFRKFYYWQVVGFAGYLQGSRWWWCVCECQRLKDKPLRRRIREDHLRQSRTKSCGCNRAALMGGNQRAAKNKATVAAPSEIMQPTALSILWTGVEGVSGGTNLEVRSKCPHGIYLTSRDLASGKATYCGFCTPKANDSAVKVHSNWCSAWNTRLETENLGEDRGLAPSVNEVTSRKARKFTKTADKVWAGGKNNILAGGSKELDVTDGNRQARELIGGRKRSATGRDSIKPWQRPDVDSDVTADSCESVVSHVEHGNDEFDRAIDPRIIEELFDNPDIPSADLDAKELREFRRQAKIDSDKESSTLEEGEVESVAASEV